jgi:hypothetical protein
MSEDKTEWMVTKWEKTAKPKAAATQVSSASEGATQQILLREKPLKQVKTFKYLGSTISANGECMQDIRIRTAIALKSIADLQATWKDQGVSIKTKMRLYKSLIQGVPFFFAYFLVNLFLQLETNMVM